MLADIRNDLAEFGVVFEVWTSERALAESGAIDHALEVLRTQGRLQEKDGALWFRASEFGDEKDRVVVRENGVKTYFASDIAYHLNKYERGFTRLLDILGRRSPRLRCTGARGTRRHGLPGAVPGGNPDPVRESVPRRRKDPDGQARGPVRDPAPAARGGRQRCVPLLLPHAQPRPAAGL